MKSIIRRWALHSLVTAVPLPWITGSAGQKIRRALIFHSLGESQEHPIVIVSNICSISWTAVMQNKENKEKSHKYVQEVLWKTLYIVSEVTQQRSFWAPICSCIGDSHRNSTWCGNASCQTKTWLRLRSGFNFINGSLTTDWLRLWRRSVLSCKITLVPKNTISLVAVNQKDSLCMHDHTTDVWFCCKKKLICIRIRLCFHVLHSYYLQSFKYWNI